MDLQKVEDLVYNYIKSGEAHSTLIGKVVMVSHSSGEENEKDMREFSQYISNLIWRAKDFDDRQLDNVKK